MSKRNRRKRILYDDSPQVVQQSEQLETVLKPNERDRTLVLSREMALKFGVNRALVIQQIYYRSRIDVIEHEGKRYANWKASEYVNELPFSERGLRGIIRSMEDDGILHRANIEGYHAYGLNYEAIKKKIGIVDR